MLWKIASPPWSVNFCDERLQFRDFGLGEPLLVLPLRRPRHRRDAVVRPDALQIRAAVRHARHAYNQDPRVRTEDFDCAASGTIASAAATTNAEAVFSMIFLNRRPGL